MFEVCNKTLKVKWWGKCKVRDKFVAVNVNVLSVKHQQLQTLREGAFAFINASH